MSYVTFAGDVSYVNFAGDALYVNFAGDALYVNFAGDVSYVTFAGGCLVCKFCWGIPCAVLLAGSFLAYHRDSRCNSSYYVRQKKSFLKSLF